MSDYDTRPTIETLLEEMKKGFAAFAEELTIIKADILEIKEMLSRQGRRQANQDARLDDFIAEVIELKRDLKHPV